MKHSRDTDRGTSDDLAKAGVRVRKDSTPEARDTDLLQRYRSVANHAIFLFSSADTVLDKYIRDHWWELDGLSADSCDIHVSMLQLFGDEDAYTQLDDVRTIPGLDSINPTELPSLHVWSRDATLRISLTPYDSESSLRDALRLVFGELRRVDSPLSVTKANEIGDSIRKLHTKVIGSNHQVSNASVGRDIVQITNNYFGIKNMPDSESARSESKQSVKGVRVSGEMYQSTDAENADQAIENATGTDAKQSVKGQSQKLSLGKYSASGKWAVVGLVLLAVIALVIKLLSG
ncbi:hypothetical protein ACMDCT_11610 [Halomonadaceae bacterium KBTZ08]